MNEDDNTLYAKWLSNELTSEEKQKLETSGEAETLRRIIWTVDSWTLPELEADVFEKTKLKLDKQKQETKIVPLFQRRSVLAIAATVALIIGLFFILRPFISGSPDMTEIACNAGETKELTLPDQTHIILYGKSKITYDKKNFSEDRKLKLEGEAFFEVNQKGAFEVDFVNGQVNVLGTKFNVLTTSEQAAVKCYEGKVKVGVENNTAVLTEGMGIRKNTKGSFSEFKFEADELPSAGAYRQIENSSLEEVCNSLSVYYDVKIVNENVDMNRIYSGQMVQTNLDSALTMIFVPMNIAFERSQNTITIRNR